jgi:hypothetical protein
MALALAFTVTERNDNKLLTITDTTGIYNAITNPTGWGDAVNVTDITLPAGLFPLDLHISITTSDGTVTAYDSIDLHALMAHHNDVSDLVFALDCSKLISSSVALGTTDTEFPDGIYDITYTLGGVGGDTVTNTELIDGRVENAAFKLLRMMNTAYEYEGCIEEGALVAVHAKTYLDGIRASNTAARRQSVLDQLYTLERILINTSAYDI